MNSVRVVLDFSNGTLVLNKFYHVSADGVESREALPIKTGGDEHFNFSRIRLCAVKDSA